MTSPLSPVDPAELQQALDETIQTIAKFCVVRIGSDELPTTVMQSARQTWLDHYTPSFTAALAAGRHWKDDRDQVLERAKEVGYLAGFLSGMRSVYQELIRAGVIAENGPGTVLGQDISLEPTYEPRIDSVVAEWAACRVDCVMSKSQPKVEWIWCPAGGGAQMSDFWRAVLPRGVNPEAITRFAALASRPGYAS